MVCVEKSGVQAPFALDTVHVNTVDPTGRFVTADVGFVGSAIAGASPSVTTILSKM